MDQSNKTGKRSDAQKQDGSRYDVNGEPVPETSPDAGAFGRAKEDSAARSNPRWDRELDPAGKK